MNQEALKNWFFQEKRSFPWRLEATPYRVWVSEVMLQQTRASVVVPYFLRWMAQFPEITALAKAPLEEVIKAWEGLGYYSRARNLHAGARQVVQEFGGKLPSSEEKLLLIRGIGPYTCAAILSFGFHKKAAAVDGNVLRVMSRYLKIEDNISLPATQKRIRREVEAMLDDKTPWVTTEALIELGATVCLPKPHCHLCPLQTTCTGFKNGSPEMLPIKNKPPKITLLQRTVLIALHRESVLVKKEKAGKVMADLYQFPFAERYEIPLGPQGITNWVLSQWGSKAQYRCALVPVSHTFTRYRAKLYPVLLDLNEKCVLEDGEWVNRSKLNTLAFAAGHRLIAQQVEKL